jgi:serine protease Do
VAQLREHGEVRRGWLGVRIQTVDEDMAEGLRLDDAYGALVASVTEGGPAEAAGIVKGDVILKFNGRVVPDMRKLPRMVAETPIGREVEVVVWRKGAEMVVKVMLGELDDEQLAAATAGPTSDAETGEVPDLGLALGALTPEVRERFGLADSAKGVVITNVDAEGSGAEKGLKPGDVIVEVDQEEVSNPAQVNERVKKAKDDGYGVVTLLVFREGDYQWVAVRIDKS